VENPWCIAALRTLLAGRSPGDPLVGLDHARYAAALKRALQRTGLHASGVPFSPHSFRAGAATQARLDGWPVPRILDAGRWASERSLRIYLDVAMALASRTLAWAQPFLALVDRPWLVGPIFLQ